MEPGDIRAAEVQAAFLIISATESKASCYVSLPRESNVRFDSVGRDDQGGFLRTDDGFVMRLSADADALDDLLAKEEVVVYQVDEDNVFMAEYPVETIPCEYGMGLSA